MDIIHTDWGDVNKDGYGIKDPLGHFDFYPNRGYLQPGCKPTTGSKSITRDIVTGVFPRCSHERSYQLFYSYHERRARCQPLAYECTDYATFAEGRCADCGTDGEKCRMIGYWPDYWTAVNITKRRMMYLKTSKDLSVCRKHFNNT